MFTGIIEETGIIRQIMQGATSASITIGARRVIEDLHTGDSISTNGVCLTAVRFGSDHFTVDVMPETLRMTNLGMLKAGSHVNLERALRLSDRLGGHLLSGHIDGTGSISRRWKEDNALWFRIAAEAGMMRYIVTKGSVAIDGISLTVAEADSSGFTVSLIPHTRSVTTLSDRNPGEVVNIECDLIAKYLEKLSGREVDRGRIDMDFLAKHGY